MVKMVLEMNSVASKKTGLFWFTNDLRIEDNPALFKAAAEVDKLICIYCVRPKSTFTDHHAPNKLSPNRQQFLFDSLIDLEKALVEQGQQLLIEFKSPADAIPELITQYNISRIYCSHNAGEYERNIWNTMRKRYAMIQFSQTDTHTLFDRSELPFTFDQLPDSFSKFRRMVEDIPAKAVQKKPPQFPSSVLTTQHNWQAIWKQQSLHTQLGDGQLFKGGAKAGRQHLENYFKSNNASTYKETRNGLDGMDYSTKFSPWLSNGSISPRQVIYYLKKYESEIEANDSTYWIYFELLWREYFQWYAHKYKAKLFKFNGIKHRNPTTSFYPERFQKWCQGNTPYPIVNACMKQLNTTGYMSNRGRQLVASCFVHELNLDWRYGAAYMEQQLIDFDVASNWGNWQYLAGVGADPRGHRRFDLAKQTKIYDPDGAFIKTWGGDQHLVQLDSRDTVDWPI
jgi:deoxyribodipyrimidine photo-lyase